MGAAVSAGVANFEDQDQDANERRWHVELVNGALSIVAWSDDGQSCDRVMLERTGIVITLKPPPAADLRDAVRAYPVLEQFVPFVQAQRRLVEAGHRTPLPPLLIHTALALQLWPIFGMKDRCPPFGAAAPFGLLVVWAPELDQFVPQPKAV